MRLQLHWLLSLAVSPVRTFTCVPPATWLPYFLRSYYLLLSMQHSLFDLLSVLSPNQCKSHEAGTMALLSPTDNQRQGEHRVKERVGVKYLLTGFGNQVVIMSKWLLEAWYSEWGH